MLWGNHIYIYYSAIREREILPFVTTWMDLEDVMPSAVKETSTVWYHLYVESKNSLTRRSRVEWWLPGLEGEGNGEMLVKEYKLPAVR